MMKTMPYPLKNIVSGAIRPGRLSWLWIGIPRMTAGWQGLKRSLGPLKIRWGLVFVLALAFMLLMGELSPAASTILTLP
jgi:hypothetical protein